MESNNNELNYLIDPNFQKIKKPFVVGFENLTDQTPFFNYYSFKVKKKNTMLQLLKDFL